MSGQEAPPIEHRIRRKDGQIIWVLNTVSSERDDQGHLIAYDGLLRDISVHRDITERKRAENLLRQERNRAPISPIDTGGTLVTCKVFGGINCGE